MKQFLLQSAETKLIKEFPVDEEQRNPDRLRFLPDTAEGGSCVLHADDCTKTDGRGPVETLQRTNLLISSLRAESHGPVCWACDVLALWRGFKSDIHLTGSLEID